MFFQEKIKDEKKETSIPNNFFEQILPILSPEMVKIFIFAYYISKNPDSSEIKSNEDLAKKLDVKLEEILKAWDFFESCGLIVKHRINEEVASEFSIEFKDLHQIAAEKPKIPEQDKEAEVQNQEYRKMYDQIERITGRPILPHDAREINKTIRAYNVPKELVIEAFKLNLYRKKSTSTNLALGVLRNWYLDGIRTTEDLETTMKHKEKRYMEYRKILQGLGEYRLPTKAEEELMDSWLDKYNFTVEVILSALTKTTAIKSPNMNYLNGILSNWNKKLKEEGPESVDKNQVIKGEKEPRDEYIEKVLKLVNFTKKAMTKEELERLNFLYDNFRTDDVELGAKWIKGQGNTVTLDYLARFLYDSSMEKNPFAKELKKPQVEEPRKIGIEDIKKLKENKGKFKSVKRDDPNTLDDLEARIAQRYQDRKKNKVNDDK